MSDAKLVRPEAHAWPLAAISVGVVLSCGGVTLIAWLLLNLLMV
jgi:hypothetical protein